MCAVATVLTIAAGPAGEISTRMPAEPSLHARLGNLEDRATALEASYRSLRSEYEREIRPLELALGRYGDDDTLVARIAVALVREGRKAGVDPRLLASVLLVEDPWLDPEAVSPQGAVGLMQVMPLHAGSWGCPSDDLTDPEINICHGARILAHDIRLEHGDLDRALLRYNGCVRGANTPDCRLYPFHVYRQQSLALLRPSGAGGGRELGPAQ